VEILWILSEKFCFIFILDPTPDPDLAKSFGSDRIRIRNTDLLPSIHTCSLQQLILAAGCLPCYLLCYLLFCLLCLLFSYLFCCLLCNFAAPYYAAYCFLLSQLLFCLLRILLCYLLAACFTLRPNLFKTLRSTLKSFLLPSLLHALHSYSPTLSAAYFAAYSASYNHSYYSSCVK
jgi:hypothetical protein